MQISREYPPPPGGASVKYSLCTKVSIGPITRQGNIPQTPSSFKIKHQHHPLILYIFNNFKIRTPRTSLPFRISQNQHAVEPNTNAVVRRNNTYFVYFINYDVKKKFLLLALVISFTFNELLWHRKSSLHCLRFAAASANTTCSFNRNLLWGNEDTFSASSNYFVHTVHCCVRPDSVAVVVSVVF